ncbi:hypothetical protein [Vibrio vulnificus YJ016]|uniref:Uncharacterized protein n=2 Tax=Vibrionaceae TaxID=641 RepID=Q7MKE2_VIBVY|nr:hypothetical protein VV86_23470 [Vibrio vulnificus]BAC94623.1 hypothetical protein [Vibrio vulnificus YJ016]
MFMTLKKTLGIPDSHELKQTSFRQKGTMAQNEYWEYDELDENGQLVARIERWDCTSLNSLTTDAGFRKYSLDGKLIAEGKY